VIDQVMHQVIQNRMKVRLDFRVLQVLSGSFQR
jgi:hypothetical protein